MGAFHDKSFPGESSAYRRARDELLAAELDLRRQVEAVAAMRRELPLGGTVTQDYVFDGVAGQTRLSALFADGKDSLVVYNFMYAPDDAAPCPMCTAMLDSLNGNAPHIRQQVNLAVVAKAPVATLEAFAASRGWNHLALLSSGGNSYNQDYFGESAEGSQLPMLNVFQRHGGAIHHCYCTEAFFAAAEAGQHNRHVDMLWPLWNVLDLTRSGRGENWFPALSYETKT
ncbi:MAG: DUF899 family protein [Proteobacteria bacterium]|nr:DUF899 family protein [Pseudomonadota bacterium]